LVTSWRLMKLPPDTIIAREKLTHYLLVRQARADKSLFLAKAGYRLENAGQLMADLRHQILPLDASLSEKNQFGDLFEIRGPLTGPNGVTLHVRTIWLTAAIQTVGEGFVIPRRRGDFGAAGT
jgi:hypothetical protein